MMKRVKWRFVTRNTFDNCLFFHAKEPVADIEAGDHYVQFLCINIERKTGGDTDGSKENQDGTDGHLEL